MTLGVKEKFSFFQSRQCNSNAKEFIQIVEPLTLRPREGDSTTGFLKLRKTVSVIKVGKKGAENYRQRIKEGCIQTREPHTKKKKLTFLKKSTWSKLSDQVQVVHKFKTRSGKINSNSMKGNEKQKFASSAKKVQNLRKVVKKGVTSSSSRSLMNRGRESEQENFNIIRDDTKLEIFLEIKPFKIDPNQSIPSNCSHDDSKKQDKEKKTADRGIYVVPLSIQSDIFGRSGAWRAWSCVWLAHLIHNAIESIPMMSGTLTPIWKQRNFNNNNSKTNILSVICNIKRVKKVRFDV